MKLWLLARKEHTPVFDVLNSIVICAKSAKQAREMAAGEAGDEGREVWLSSKHSECVEMRPLKRPAVIISDFRAG